MDRRKRLGLTHVITGTALFAGYVPGFVADPSPLFSVFTLSVALVAFGSVGLLVGGILAFVRPGYAGRLAIETDPSRLHCRVMYVLSGFVVLGTLLLVA